MISHTKTFLIGTVAGIIVSKLIRTNSFRQSCARVLSAGIQLNSDSSQSIENIKEEAEENSAKK